MSKKDPGSLSSSYNPAPAAAAANARSPLSTSSSGPSTQANPNKAKAISNTLGAAFGHVPRPAKSADPPASNQIAEPAMLSKRDEKVAPAKKLWSCEDSERYVCHRKGTSAMAPVWQADTVTSQCAVCHAPFGLWVRKHHCRMCGYVVCEECSKHRLALPELGYKGDVRVCDFCFKKAKPIDQPGARPAPAAPAPSPLASMAAAAGPPQQPYSQPPFPALVEEGPLSSVSFTSPERDRKHSRGASIPPRPAPLVVSASASSLPTPGLPARPDRSQSSSALAPGSSRSPRTAYSVPSHASQDDKSGGHHSKRNTKEKRLSGKKDLAEVKPTAAVTPSKEEGKGSLQSSGGLSSFWNLFRSSSPPAPSPKASLKSPSAPSSAPPAAALPPPPPASAAGGAAVPPPSNEEPGDDVGGSAFPSTPGKVSVISEAEHASAPDRRSEAVRADSESDDDNQDVKRTSTAYVASPGRAQYTMYSQPVTEPVKVPRPAAPIKPIVAPVAPVPTPSPTVSPRPGASPFGPSPTAYMPAPTSSPGSLASSAASQPVPMHPNLANSYVGMNDIFVAPAPTAPSLTKSDSVSSSASLVPAAALAPSPAPSLRATMDSSPPGGAYASPDRDFTAPRKSTKHRKELKVLSYAAVSYASAASGEATDEAKKAKEVEEKIKAAQRAAEESAESSPFSDAEPPKASLANSLRAIPADQLKAALLAINPALSGSLDVSALFRSLNSSGGSTTGSEKFRGAAFSLKDWNKEFQDEVDKQLPLLNGPDFVTVPAFQESQFKLSALVNDFRQSAVTYGKVIISELPLPVSVKSIKPANVGGVAGGEKYVVAGILFKFALDQNIANEGEAPLYLYGGPNAEDELAAKAAGRELNGACWIAAVSGVARDRVRVPLMCLVDYRGFRLVASSVLPIGKDTLKYGSQDAGHTVLAENEQLNNSFKIIMERLSLAPHLVGYKVSNEIYGPGDIEGHEGRDGHFYSVDFARLFPPEAPSLDPRERAKHRRGVFYRMLRPEAIMRQPLALSSDAFSGWSTVDPLRAEHERDVRTVTTWIFDRVIPRFAQLLDQQFESEGRADPPAFFRATKVGDMMHQHGINMRHLGKVRRASTVMEVRNWCLTEAVARVCKNQMRASMRRCLTTNQNVTPGEVPIKMLITDYINKLCSNARSAMCSYSAGTATEFWDIELRERLAAKFTDIFEENDFTSLRHAVDPAYVITYLQNTLNFTLSPYLSSMIDKRDVNLQSTIIDISNLDVRVKEMYIGKSASAYFLYGQSKTYEFDTDARRLLQEAESQLREAWHQVPTDALLNLQYGIVLAELAKRSGDLGYYERAYEMFNLVLRTVPLAEAICILVDVKQRHANVLRAGGQGAEAKELEEQVDALRQLLPSAKTIKDVFDFADSR